MLVRVHSECLTGDVFHSLRCDCGEQLESALAQIEREGRGVLLYLAQEGRGIGLLNKLKAYNAAGRRARHGRRQPRAGPAGRPARLRHRRADPRRPRADLDPDPDQQPEEDHRARGLRPVGHRAGADPARAQPAQRALPERQARPARPHAPPPGPRARRGDAARRARARPRRPRSRAAGAARGRARRPRRGRYAIAVGRFYEDLAGGSSPARARRSTRRARAFEVYDVRAPFELPLAAL